nr:hypothetical protein [Tanacetum cinerariifolium]
GHLVRDANTIKVFFKNLIFEFCVVVGSYDDDGRLKKDSDSLQEGFNHFWSNSLPVGNHLRKDLGLLGLATTLRRREDPIILCIAPRLWPSGLSVVTPVEDKPFELEFTTFLVMTGGCETVIGFILTLALTLLGTCYSSLEELKGLILNIPGAITLTFFTTFDPCGVGVEFEVTGFDKA